jgi:cytochrome b6-f complex iron-sulfur subunit
MPDLNRRHFVAAATAAVACACCLYDEATAAETAAAAPSGPVDVGTKADYPKDGAMNDKYAKPKEYRILVVRNEGKIYAINSTCTHKNCAVKPKDETIACPCHGSKFSLRGTSTKGPAKGSLSRYAISVNDAGRIMVDRSKSFSEKEWDNPSSFVTV